MSSPNNNIENSDRASAVTTANEAGDVVTRVSPPEQQQTVAFTDAADHTIVAKLSELDPTFNMGCGDQDGIAEFLSRPIEIASYNISQNLDIDNVINVWEDFLNNSYIKKKTDNYTLLRGKMMVKAVINGTKFSYGRFMLSYMPWYTHDTFNFIGNGYTQEGLIQLSQRPMIQLNPTDCTGGCLCLPFYSVDNWIDLTNSTAIGELGQLRFTSINQLRNANVNTDPISVSIFAWMEDVELSIPTTVIRQSGRGKTFTFNEEPVSFIASAVGKVSTALADVPVIGVFAKATGIAAGAVGKIAHLFGFSRPPLIVNKMPMKNIQFSNFSNMQGPELVQKLTADPKQELTIDPRTTGLGNIDEMSIKRLAGSETYLTTFPWTTAAPTATLLWCTNVTPQLGLTSSGVAISSGPYVKWVPTSLGLVSSVFSDWCGTLKFRFQIVCSDLHKGRIKICYDPKGGSIATDMDTYNISYTRVLDISKEKDIIVEIPWAQQTNYLHTMSMLTHVPQEDLYDVAPVTLDSTLSNGLMAVWVLNDLTAPVDLANIEINVYVSAGDDFELKNPVQNTVEQSTIFVPQSASGENLVTLFDTTRNDADVKSEIFYGESVSSIRSLMKRVSKHNCYFIWGSLPSFGVVKLITSVFPFYRGYDPNGIHNDAGVQINYCHTTFINYFSPAYVGWRGTLRYRAHVMTTQKLNFGLVEKMHDDVPGYQHTVNSLIANTNSPSDVAHQNLDLIDSGMTGSILYDLSKTPAMEFDHPFHTRFRFAFCRDTDVIAGNSRDETDLMRQKISVAVNGYDVADGNKEMAINTYVSAGEDFMLTFFVGSPPIYFVFLPNP